MPLKSWVNKAISGVVIYMLLLIAVVTLTLVSRVLWGVLVWGGGLLG